MDAHVSAPNREGLLDRVFHGSLAGMLVARLDDGVVLEANDRFCALLGPGLADLLGSDVDALGLWGELGPEGARAQLRETGLIDGYDTRPAGGGSGQILRVWAEVVDGGDPLVVIRASDVDGGASTGSRYQELREAEAKYRTLIEQLPAVVYLAEYGEQGNWLYISPQIEQVHGLTPAEWLEHEGPATTFTHPDDLTLVRAEEERSRATGTPFRAEYRLRTKDGRWLWILDEGGVVRDDDGQPLFMQGLMYDITERKRAEERLVALDALKNTLLHTLSHDLKEPLTAILGAASTLERLNDVLEPDERTDLLRTMVARTKGMNALLTDLLDLERLDRGIVEPRRFPVDLVDLVRELIPQVDVLHGRHVEVVGVRCIADVDTTKVERMVENLLVNAARHTPPDSRIWVRLTTGAEGAMIAVEDEGPGVPDTLKGEIFEAFRRVNDAQAGSGIGLSLVARFAQLHGGRAWVQDREGGGASFRVWLPSPSARASAT
jgi:PAS domain S-box-containing protein